MTNTYSPLGRPQRSRRSLEGGHRRAQSFGAALALTVAALLVIGAAPSFAVDPLPNPDPACTKNVQNGKGCISVTDTPDPVSFSSFDGNDTFLKYSTTVSNSAPSRSSLSHVGVTVFGADLPAGATIVAGRVTCSTGTTCSNSPDGQSITWTIGRLAKGQSKTMDVVFTAPPGDASSPDPTRIDFRPTLSFDERFSDQLGGKQDTVTYDAPTNVSRTVGKTYVPRGEDGKVNTDPSQAQYANTTITNASVDLLATIKVLTADNFCIGGQVRIQTPSGPKVYVCRAGGWVEESVVNAATGMLYSNPDFPVVKHLRWSAGLSSFLQTSSNFVVFDQATATSPVQVIGDSEVRCNAPVPSATPPTNMPCITNVVHEADGGWSVDYVRPDDRRMR